MLKMNKQMKEQKLPLIKLESNRIKKEKTFQFDDDEDDEDVGMDGGNGGCCQLLRHFSRKQRLPSTIIREWRNNAPKTEPTGKDGGNQIAATLSLSSCSAGAGNCVQNTSKKQPIFIH